MGEVLRGVLTKSCKSHKPVWYTSELTVAAPQGKTFIQYLQPDAGTIFLITGVGVSTSINPTGAGAQSIAAGSNRCSFSLSASKNHRLYQSNATLAQNLSFPMIQSVRFEEYILLLEDERLRITLSNFSSNGAQAFSFTFEGIEYIR